MVAAPIALRRFNTYRNEVMDGAILTGAGAAGFAIGSAIIFWAPIFNHGGPSIDVSDWTLMIIGMAIVRPVVITLAGAMLGAGIWRYMMTPKTSILILPAAGSIGGMILLYLGSLWIQPSGGGIWPEALWLVLVGIAVFILYRMVLAAAIDQDRRALGGDGTRLVCPHCHRLTLKAPSVRAAASHSPPRRISHLQNPSAHREQWSVRRSSSGDAHVPGNHR